MWATVECSRVELTTWKLFFPFQQGPVGPAGPKGELGLPGRAVSSDSPAAINVLHTEVITQLVCVCVCLGSCRPDGTQRREGRLCCPAGEPDSLRRHIPLKVLTLQEKVGETRMTNMRLSMAMYFYAHQMRRKYAPKIH